MKKILMFALSAFLLVGCATTGTVDKNKDSEVEKPDTSETTPDQGQTMVATIVTSEGEITIELYQDIAPESVNNFATLASSGFYDGVIFHRVIPGFMIQGGDPDGNGTGGPGYSIKGEFSSNNVKNDLKHERGVLSMARSGHPDSAGSQFFIMHQNAPHLDGDYAAFGKVIKGIEVVDAIAAIETKQDRPVKEVSIKSIKVDTKGLDISDFTKIK